MAGPLLGQIPRRGRAWVRVLGKLGPQPPCEEPLARRRGLATGEGPALRLPEPVRWSECPTRSAVGPGSRLPGVCRECPWLRDGLTPTLLPPGHASSPGPPQPGCPRPGRPSPLASVPDTVPPVLSFCLPGRQAAPQNTVTPTVSVPSLRRPQSSAAPTSLLSTGLGLVLRLFLRRLCGRGLHPPTHPSFALCQSRSALKPAC